jgi:hypothetical protein
VSFRVSAGQTYYIVVDGVSGAYGTAYLRYSLNTSPTISAPASVSISEDSSSGARSFTISDRETAAGSLTVEAYSYNSSIVPSWNISLGGSGSQRTVSVTPAANASGSVTIMLTVRDQSGLASSTYFTVNVTAVNDAPSVSSDYVSRASRYGSTSIHIPKLLSNDRDVDGDAVSFSSFTNGSAGGRVTRSGDYLTYTPGSSNAESFSYTVTDGKGGYATGQVLVGN